jgi:hypothetical protein
MGRKDRLISGGSQQAATKPKKSPYASFLNYALTFLFGAAAAGGTAVMLYERTPLLPYAGQASADTTASNRTVAQLMALSNAELEKVDIVGMSVAVAREIPGQENLDYQHYREIVDGWTDQFRRWMPTAEANFLNSPQQWRGDINFFRLGLLATYLTRERGVRYDEKYSQDQKEGKNSKYKEPGAVLVHGLIDTLRGTCATMPVLHVAIGRRLGWPVSLAAVGPHYVCRYDDGKVHYNIEATYTGPGFVSDADEDYMKNDHLPKKALTSGSDFRSLSAREMLGVFVAARARYYRDTSRFGEADRDYALARVLYPNHRYAYRESILAFLWRGEQLFDPTETGHPADLAGYLAATYLRAPQRPTAMNQTPYQPPVNPMDPMAEIERINAMNRANMLPQTPGVPRPPTQGPQMPQPGVPQPGFPQPYQPFQPPMPGQPPR